MHLELPTADIHSQICALFLALFHSISVWIVFSITSSSCVASIPYAKAGTDRFSIIKVAINRLKSFLFIVSSSNFPCVPCERTLIMTCLINGPLEITSFLVISYYCCRLMSIQIENFYKNYRPNKKKTPPGQPDGVFPLYRKPVAA